MVPSPVFRPIWFAQSRTVHRSSKGSYKFCPQLTFLYFLISIEKGGMKHIYQPNSQRRYSRQFIKALPGKKQIEEIVSKPYVYNGVYKIE